VAQLNLGLDCCKEVQKPATSTPRSGASNAAQQQCFAWAPAPSVARSDHKERGREAATAARKRGTPSLPTDACRCASTDAAGMRLAPSVR